MKKLLLVALMVATASPPALAARGWESRDGSNRAEQSQRVERDAQPDQQSRGNWRGRNTDAQTPVQTAPNPVTERPRWGGNGGWNGRQGPEAQPVPQSPEQRAMRREMPRTWNGQPWNRNEGWRERQAPSADARPSSRDWQARRPAESRPFPNQRNWDDRRIERRAPQERGWGQNNGSWQDRSRNGARQYDRRSWGDNEHRRWDRNWRNDNRYDWQRWRNRNSYVYRAPRYYAPRGWDWGYRRFSIGIMLDSLLWNRNYWIDDPWAYRLPPADWPYQWVRYYNDVMLVDTESGYVVDVIYDFFL